MLSAMRRSVRTRYLPCKDTNNFSFEEKISHYQDPQHRPHGGGQQNVQYSRNRILKAKTFLNDESRNTLVVSAFRLEW